MAERPPRRLHRHDRFPASNRSRLRKRWRTEDLDGPCQLGRCPDPLEVERSRSRKAPARELLASGETPTVEDTAAAASIFADDRLCYFTNQRALLVAAHPEIEVDSLLGDDPPEDPAHRLALALEAFTRLTLETEPQLRTMLRLSLEPGPGHELLLRRGRAIGWFEEALEPLRERLGDGELRRLVLAICSACGIEALVWLTDVAGLSRPEGGQPGALERPRSSRARDGELVTHADDAARRATRRREWRSGA